MPPEDFDEAMSRVMQLVKLAQNREVQPEQQVQPDQQVQPEQPDLDYVDLSDKTVLEIDVPRGRPTNATVKRRCLLKRKAYTDVPAPNKQNNRP